MYQFKCMYNQFSIASPYGEHLVISHKCPLCSHVDCRGFLNSGQLPIVDNF